MARRPARKSRRFSVVTGGEGGARPGVDLADNAAVRDLMDAG
jgi:hypothetical protein